MTLIEAGVISQQEVFQDSPFVEAPEPYDPLALKPGGPPLDWYTETEVEGDVHYQLNGNFRDQNNGDVGIVMDHWMYLTAAIYEGPADPRNDLDKEQALVLHNAVVGMGDYIQQHMGHHPDAIVARQASLYYIHQYGDMPSPSPAPAV